MNPADIHACTYQCDRPICIRRQRDELYAAILLRVPGFTAADMADQYATAFERGRESVLAEQAAAAQEAVEWMAFAKATAYCDVESDPAGTLIVEPGKPLEAASTPAAPVIDHAKLNELLNAAGDAAAVLQNKAAPLGQETSRRLYAALNAFLATLAEKKR